MLIKTINEKDFYILFLSYDFMPKEDMHDDSMLAQGQRQASELALVALLLICSIVLRYDNKYY